MSQAVPLYHADGKHSGVFYCSECRAVFNSEDQAASCHGMRECQCGNKIERRYSPVCDACQRLEWKRKSAEEERNRFDAAKKISAAEYMGGMVYSCNRYYADVDEAIDQYLEGQEPEYVWACKDVGIPMATSENIVDNLLDNMWEDADPSDLNGLDELDEAIKAFNEANRAIHVWEPDYSTAILTHKLAAKEPKS